MRIHVCASVWVLASCVVNRTPPTPVVVVTDTPPVDLGMDSSTPLPDRQTPDTLVSPELPSTALDAGDTQPSGEPPPSDSGTDAPPSDLGADALGDLTTDLVGDLSSDTPSDTPSDTTSDTPTDGGPAPRNRALAGPFRVAAWTGAIAGTPGSAAVYYPDDPGTERFPLAVFAHGFQLRPEQYSLLLRHVASHGYVVASVDYPGNLLFVDHREVPAALTAARVALGTGTVPFPGRLRVDGSRAAALGHSLGGKGAIMALLGDRGFLAGVALDPVDDNPAPFGLLDDAHPSIAPERMPSLTRPLALVGATQSRCGGLLNPPCAPEASDYRAFASSAPATVPHPVFPLLDYGHMDFVDPGCGLTCGVCATGRAPLESRQGALRAVVVAFLDRHLRGDTTAEPLLTGAERDALVRAGALWDGRLDTLPRCP